MSKTIAAEEIAAVVAEIERAGAMQWNADIVLTRGRDGGIEARRTGVAYPCTVEMVVVPVHHLSNWADAYLSHVDEQFTREMALAAAAEDLIAEVASRY